MVSDVNGCDVPVNRRIRRERERRDRDLLRIAGDADGPVFFRGCQSPIKDR